MVEDSGSGERQPERSGRRHEGLHSRKDLLKGGLALGVGGATLGTLGRLAGPSPAASAASRAAASVAVDGPFALVGGSVLKRDGSGWLRDHTVVVRGGRITAIGPRGTVGTESGVEQADVRGRFVIPGLIDSHVHFYTDDAASSEANNRHILEMFLVNGITSVLCLDGSPSVLRLGQEVEDGTIVGPTLKTSGPIQNDPRMTFRQGYNTAIAQAKAGYQVIKVYTFLNEPGYRGILAGAKKAGIRVVGHIPGVGGVSFHELLMGSQEAVVHAEEVMYSAFPPGQSDKQCWIGLECWNRDPHVWESAAYGPDAREKVARELKKHRKEVTGTLETFQTIARVAQDVETWARSQPMEYVPKSYADQLINQNPYAGKFHTPRLRRTLIEALDFQFRLIGDLHRAGVRITSGTDASITLWGFSLSAEINNLALSGLGNVAALRAATANGGKFIYSRDGDQVGVIKRNARADLTVLKKDPLTDPLHTRTVCGVLTHGQWHDADSLDQRRQALRDAAPNL